MTATGFVLAAGVLSRRCGGICRVAAVAIAQRRRCRRSPRDNVDLYRQRVEEIERERDAGILDDAVAESLPQELSATLLDDATAHGARGRVERALEMGSGRRDRRDRRDFADAVRQARCIRRGAARRISQSTARTPTQPPSRSAIW